MHTNKKFRTSYACLVYVRFGLGVYRICVKGYTNTFSGNLVSSGNQGFNFKNGRRTNQKKKRIFSISRVAIKNSWFKAKKENNDNDSFQTKNRDHSFSTYAKFPKN